MHTTQNNQPIAATPAAFFVADQSQRDLSANLTTDVEQLVATLTSGKPAAITFEQIETNMMEAGYNPYEASDLYQSIIDSLEQQDILVVETLETDQSWVDEDTTAKNIADEVWEMLKRVKLPADEYQHPILPAHREQRLIEIYQDGKRAQTELSGELSRMQRRSAERRIEASSQALDELMRCNLRLVTQTAVRIARYTSHLQLDDLIQEGRIGLFKAIDRFDLSINLRLSTYATWWIRQAIERAVGDNDRMIRLPIHVQETLRHLKQVRERWITETGTDPTDQELADVLRLPIKKVKFLHAAAQHMISLDTPVGATGESVLGDLIPDFRQYEPSRFAERHALQITLKNLLNQLTERERRVLQLRYGLIDGQERTLETVGREFGVTRERIRQIEVKALRKLQHPRMSKQLRDFLL